MKKENQSPAKLIDAKIKDLGDWRGETLAKVRALILSVNKEITEEWKWDVPVWSKDGIICTGETYKDKVKLTFAKGAHLKDSKKLFNSSLEGNLRRALDLFEGDKINATAFKALIKEAIKLNSR